MTADATDERGMQLPGGCTLCIRPCGRKNSISFASASYVESDGGCGGNKNELCPPQRSAP